MTFNDVSTVQFSLHKCALTYLFLVFLSSATAFAQNVTGRIEDSTGVLGGAIIRNLRTNERAMSNTNGIFSIKAVRGDKLTTTFIGYSPDTLLLGNQNYLLIELKPDARMLNDVVIKGKRLTPLEQYRKNQEDFKEIYRIGDKSHMFFASTGTRSAGVGLNIDALYSALSRQGKNARRLQRTLTNDYHNSVVDSRFTKELVGRVTGYQGQQLENFIVDNRPSYEFIITVSDYDLIEYIKHKMDGTYVARDYPPLAEKGHGMHVKFKMNNQLRSTPRMGADNIPMRYP